MSDQSEVMSCGVLLVRGTPIQSFLLMKHVDRWDLPKGHVDLGESDLECALREMEEETGVSRDEVQLDPDFLFVHQYYVQNSRTSGVRKLKTLKIYLGRVADDVVITPTEHPDFEWISWSPPHSIQAQTIDPLMAAVEQHFANQK